MVREELQVTASLAHLDLSEDEIAAALPAFELMLEYFAAMKAADEDKDTFGVSVMDMEPAVHGSQPGNRVRLDLLNATNNNKNSNPPSNLANELVNRAPECENRCIVIPNVL
jgi:Asp-tRNA(Asn)/Glu-tRNA(Gln) amidotransferase C subunit